MMNLKEMKELSNEVLTEQQFTEVEESEFVTEVQDNGMSGVDPTNHYYTVVFTDGTEMDIYFKA